MLLVPIKAAEQKNVLLLHRARQGFAKACTAQANQICGLLSEYGVVIPQGTGHGRVAQRLPQIKLARLFAVLLRDKRHFSQR